MERTGHDRRFSRNSDGYESRPYDSQRTQAYKLKSSALGINGEGIAYKNRKPVFVDGVIPEETALIEITEDNEKYAKENWFGFSKNLQDAVIRFVRLLISAAAVH